MSLGSNWRLRKGCFVRQQLGWVCSGYAWLFQVKCTIKCSCCFLEASLSGKWFPSFGMQNKVAKLLHFVTHDELRKSPSVASKLLTQHWCNIYTPDTINTFRAFLPSQLAKGLIRLTRILKLVIGMVGFTEIAVVSDPKFIKLQMRTQYSFIFH